MGGPKVVWGNEPIRRSYYTKVSLHLGVVGINAFLQKKLGLLQEGRTSVENNTNWVNWLEGFWKMDLFSDGVTQQYCWVLTAESLET